MHKKTNMETPVAQKELQSSRGPAYVPAVQGKDEPSPTSSIAWPRSAPDLKVADRLGDQLTVQCELVEHPSARYTFRIGRPGYIRTIWMENPEAENLNPADTPHFAFDSLSFDATYVVRVEVHSADEDSNKPVRISRAMTVSTLNAASDAIERERRTARKNKELRTELQRKEEQIENLRTTLQQNESEFGTCEENLESLWADVEKKEGEIQEMEQRIDAMSSELQRKDEEIQRIKQEYEQSLHQERVQREGSSTRLQQALDEAKQEARTAHKQAEETQASNDDLKKQLERSKTDREELHSKVSALGSELDSVQKEKDEVEKRYTRLQQEHRDIEAENQRLKSELAEAEQRLQSKDLTVEETSKRAKELEEQLANIENKTTESTTRLSEEREKIEEAHRENESLVEQLSGMQSQNKDLEEKFHEEKTEHENTCKRFREEIDSLNQENLSLRKELESAPSRKRQEEELLSEAESRKKYQNLLDTVISQLGLDEQLKTMDEESTKASICNCLHGLHSQKMELENIHSEMRLMQDMQRKDRRSVASLMFVNPDDLQRLEEIVNGNDAESNFSIAKIAKTLKESRGDVQRSVDSLIRERRSTQATGYEDDY